ncbi:MAG: hypothetical protein GY839_18790 [candidate division Zixibacteria bacterium]|nr:hypothetical protein [candidate division Zixibacteria bacterium]
MSMNDQGDKIQEKSRILIFSSSLDFQELLTDIFPKHNLEFIAEPKYLANSDYLHRIFTTNPYEILILSNFEIPIDIVKQHIFLIPQNGKFEVLLISGLIDEEIRDLCNSRGINTLSLPFKADALKAIISDLYQ